MLHHVFGLFITLAFAVLGPGAVAHGMGATGQTMLVICGSEGAETIWIDALGNPVEHDQTGDDCPKCAESVADAFDHGPFPSVIRFYQDQAHPRLPTGLPPTIQSHLRPATRAPPSPAPLWLMTGRHAVIPMDCPRHV